MTSVTLGEKVRTVGRRAFYEDENILTITCKSMRPASVDGNYDVFSENVYTDATLHVPNGSLQLYYTAPVWMKFDNIVEDGAVQPLKGDVNGDGAVDIDDVNSVIKIIIHKE